MSAWSGNDTKKYLPVLLAEHGNLCVLCGEPCAPDELSVEHLIPRSTAPELSHDLDNLRISHKSCNFSRGNRSIETFRSHYSNNLSWWNNIQ
ncbi:HNH endonuclease [Psychromicrobium sp. YIM B11713]|uniref:HNH endonuclease n=1 Tax=Psychromicrobium sp. YIM B11713 TaxID=3145233 RepID=UPI00374E234F